MIIRPNELPESTLERQLSDEIVRFLSVENAEHGNDMYHWFRDYYLSEGIGLAPHDVAASWFIKQNFPNKRTVEIGAGMAQMSALLAGNGFTATAIETTRAHVATARRLHDWLTHKNYPSYEILSGWFPNVGSDRIDGSVVVGLSISFGVSEEQWNYLLDALAPASAIVMDITQFFTVRRDAASKADLASQLAERGLSKQQEIFRWNHGEGYKFYPGEIVCFTH